MKKICMLGMGYIGLPTAIMFATHGLQVIGVDINQHIVEALKAGKLHIKEPGLGDVLSKAIASGNLIIQTALELSDAFIIAVPTPINPDKTADMRAVISATEAIVPHLRPGNLVVLESTSPPLTTASLVKPILERSGLKAGQDFLLAYSPERVLPGQILKELVENARVIGGINATSAQAGRELYASFVKGEIVLTDATTAEMVKLMENTFRDVNIALANEFALIAEKLGINVWEAIETANRHPRVKILRPGPGVGGHCIAVDPWFLVEAAPEQARLIHQARLVNDGMPAYTVEKVKQAIVGVDKPIIACLGVTYKANVDDIRESPAIEVIEKLLHAGLTVRVFDPHAKTPQALSAYWTTSLEAAITGADLLVVLVDHDEFTQLAPEALASMRQRRVLDTRNCLQASAWRQAGCEVTLLGAA